jgi:hypothetical protein
MYIIRALALLFQKLSIIPAIVIIILFIASDGSTESDTYLVVAFILYFLTGYGWYYAIEREIDTLKKIPKKYIDNPFQKYNVINIETDESQKISNYIAELEKQHTIAVIIFWWWIAIRHLNSFLKFKLE